MGDFVAVVNYGDPNNLTELLCTTLGYPLKGHYKRVI